MPSKKSVIKTYVTSEEYLQIVENASKGGLSLSTFVKRACLGQRIESTVDSRAVLELVKINADMGRLGGLLKLWLSGPCRHTVGVRIVLNDLLQLKEELAAKIRTL